ncbi:hypothetical protein FHL15_006798 [Xylaria flabelliformis]|uniref:Uncharacterized protein n=1 Tax=Xylaria flabelliformis TaxID=2512241 RepID=A0A553HW68_9PEZI|nr:hypothetical protein FHL15_006798 [Xylaria flabelliformis]
MTICDSFYQIRRDIGGTAAMYSIALFAGSSNNTSVDLCRKAFGRRTLEKQSDQTIGVYWLNYIPLSGFLASHVYQSIAAIHIPRLKGNKETFLHSCDILRNWPVKVFEDSTCQDGDSLDSEDYRTP